MDLWTSGVHFCGKCAKHAFSGVPRQQQSYYDGSNPANHLGYIYNPVDSEIFVISSGQLVQDFFHPSPPPTTTPTTPYKTNNTNINRNNKDNDNNRAAVEELRSTFRTREEK